LIIGFIKSGVIMITRIGLVAGDIWNYLEAHKRKASVNDMIEDLNKDKNIVLMSLGWLAREGHIVLEGDEGNYTVILTS
jgi:chitinase